ncbi:ATP-binding protein [Paludisphaera sp.]|uniref:PAS domain-containing sensor histidine kinase n=1 Tax=Paludisphaera sp. TaxID=2017432 RepID=UPI00301E1050
MTTVARSDDRGDGEPALGWAEAAPVALIEATAGGRATACNDRWRDFAGLGPGGPPEGLAERLHPEDAPAWLRSLADGAPFEADCRLRGGDGRHRWFRIRVAPRRDAAGEVSSWVAACSDVDDLVRARDDLRRACADLEQFASIAAHDLQEPLRKVQAFGERLAARCGPLLDERGRDYLARMFAAVARLRGLIRDVLAYSRAEAPCRPTPRVDLSAVAAEVVDDLAEAIERSGGVVEVGPLPTARADPAQMRQLLQNLIANSLKFARPGEPPRVRVSGRVDPGGACAIEVADDGLGFEPGDAERIFEPFRRLHGRGEREGSGMGLAICRRIAERHGGSITAEGAPGAGAVFRVSIPDDPTSTR